MQEAGEGRRGRPRGCRSDELADEVVIRLGRKSGPTARHLAAGEMSRWMRFHIAWNGDIVKYSDGPARHDSSRFRDISFLKKNKRAPHHLGARSAAENHRGARRRRKGKGEQGEPQQQQQPLEQEQQPEAAGPSGGENPSWMWGEEAAGRTMAHGPAGRRRQAQAMFCRRKCTSSRAGRFMPCLTDAGVVVEVLDRVHAQSGERLDVATALGQFSGSTRQKKARKMLLSRQGSRERTHSGMGDRLLTCCGGAASARTCRGCGHTTDP